ncbi:MAG TPA: hypothetical protein VM490_23960, partial [Armatimonadaceae bacterium]|nr:hypothetical protein [Armatimonadaceae bacterium]
MTGWHLTTLGRVPALHHPATGARVTRLRSKRAFALLASLALDPATCTVDALAERLWPDAGSETAAGSNLRTALRLLRQAAGADLFASERGIVRLAPGTLSGGVDLTDARDAFDAIRRASATLAPDERAARLRDVARALSAGGFLEGLDLSGPWIDGERARADALRAEVHLSLALALEEAGDPAERRAAFEAAALAFSLLPDLKGAESALLR